MITLKYYTNNFLNKFLKQYVVKSSNMPYTLYSRYCTNEITNFLDPQYKKRQEYNKIFTKGKTYNNTNMYTLLNTLFKNIKILMLWHHSKHFVITEF